jgi:glutathione S-transferase
MRARLALDVSGEVYELREVRLRDKPAELLRVSAKATVPVLVLQDGRVLDESLDIMLWALGRNDPEHWLTPDGMRELIHRFDSHFKPHLDRYKYPRRFPGADPLVDRAAACGDLAVLEERLTRTAYLAGGHVSLADMAIVPFVRQFANVDADWFASQSWSALQRWLKTLVESARFERIMQQVAVWVPA